MSTSEEITSHVEQIRCRNLQYRDTLAGAHSQLNVHDMSDDSLNVDVGSCSSEKASSGNVYMVGENCITGGVRS